MAEINTAALEQQWTHSHEEDGQDTLVFRPASWSFPPSRGRRSFNLAAGGHLLASGPGRDDRTVQTIGSWRLLPGGIVELNQDGKPSRLRVLRVESDRLEIAR